ncbi:cytochrome P450 [Pseudosulfitobacter koreensis]|uniref:Cytochrome P450 n=1 Tax=Pseudosulfitobacter koreensis TaxID=2968472 RepID=A0ABT1Z088_9RHOB|nr:cytochrome P450 [Pseudosulfitobacter koreense]MCR8826539.1 cytochrome P450 [Pseudosulfitobacter koreense]
MFDLASSEFNSVRYEIYGKLLTDEPVFWYEPMQSWLVCRFDHIQQVIKSNESTTDFLIEDKIANSGDALGDGTRAVLDIVRTWMIYNDGATHTRLRKFMNQAFAKHHIDRVLPNIKQIIDTRFAQAIQGQTGPVELDIIETFAHPVPAQILQDMLGLDEISLEDFLRWSDSIALFMQDFVVSPVPNNDIAVQTALDLQAMVDAFRASIQLRKHKPRNDLLSALVTALETSEHRLTEDELCYQLIHLIFGGHKIPQFVISNTLNLLFQNPDVADKLRDGTVDIRSVINEAMRVEGPIQFITRHATTDFELGGKKIAKGESIFLMLGAANRDPLCFDQPDRFAPDLKRRNSLAFGSGAHVCIGATLVIAELQEIFDALLNSEFDLTPLYDVNAPAWTENATFHGITRMPIALQRKTASVAAE